MPGTDSSHGRSYSNHARNTSSKHSRNNSNHARSVASQNRNTSSHERNNNSNGRNLKNHDTNNSAHSKTNSNHSMMLLNSAHSRASSESESLRDSGYGVEVIHGSTHTHTSRSNNNTNHSRIMNSMHSRNTTGSNHSRNSEHDYHGGDESRENNAIHGSRRNRRLPSRQDTDSSRTRGQYMSTSFAGVNIRTEGSIESETALSLKGYEYEEAGLRVVHETHGHESPHSGPPRSYDSLHGRMSGSDSLSAGTSLSEEFEVVRRGMPGTTNSFVERERQNDRRSSMLSKPRSYNDKSPYPDTNARLAPNPGLRVQFPNINESLKSGVTLNSEQTRQLISSKRPSFNRIGSRMYAKRTKMMKAIEDKESLSEFTRWGGRKDSSKKSGDKKGLLKKFHSMKRQTGRQSLTAAQQNSNRSTGSRSHGLHDLWGFAFKSDHVEYKNLMDADKQRERVASFCEEPFWKIIFHFQGTVLRVIIEDVLFWLTIALYVGIRCQFRFSTTIADSVTNYDNLSDNLVYVGGFLLFFLVFYVNQNHHRYFQLHKDSMILMGRVNDVATMAKATLPYERARRIVRYMNAAHIVTYTGLSSNYEKTNFFDPLEARYGLLTEEELYRITEEMDIDMMGPNPAHEMIAWIMMDLRDAQVCGFIDTNEAKQLREQVLFYRSTIAKIFVTTTLPIPFFYVHFLSMLTAVYLPLFSVVVAFEAGGKTTSTVVSEIVSGLVVFLQALFVIGLRILGQQLSDPFGGDLIDLQVLRYINLILMGSNRILAAKKLRPPSLETETKLHERMSTLGPAFEYKLSEEVVSQPSQI